MFILHSIITCSIHTYHFNTATDVDRIELTHLKPFPFHRSRVVDHVLRGAAGDRRSSHESLASHLSSSWPMGTALVSGAGGDKVSAEREGGKDDSTTIAPTGIRI